MIQVLCWCGHADTRVGTNILCLVLVYNSIVCQNVFNFKQRQNLLCLHGACMQVCIVKDCSELQ